MTQVLSTPNQPDAVARLLAAARYPAPMAGNIPTLHERRVEGLEAAQRLRDRPRP